MPSSSEFYKDFQDVTLASENNKRAFYNGLVFIMYAEELNQCRKCEINFDKFYESKTSHNFSFLQRLLMLKEVCQKILYGKLH